MIGTPRTISMYNRAACRAIRLLDKSATASPSPITAAPKNATTVTNTVMPIPLESVASTRA